MFEVEHTPHCPKGRWFERTEPNPNQKYPSRFLVSIEPSSVEVDQAA